MKKLVVAFVLLGLVTLLVAACDLSPGGGSSDNGGSNQVHLTSSNFAQPSITISKGSSITLVSDTAVTHIISNGMWVNNTPKPGAESGAPTASNIMLNSTAQTSTVGPFNTASTFHYFCSIHPGMNLTVIVQ